MDIEEFQKHRLPRAKRSKLEPFINEIRQLKENGYANYQVCEWLASNDVKISIEGFRKFWVKVEASITAARPARQASTPTPQPAGVRPPATRTPTPKATGSTAPRKFEYDPLSRPDFKFVGDKDEKPDDAK